VNVKNSFTVIDTGILPELFLSTTDYFKPKSQNSKNPAYVQTNLKKSRRQFSTVLSVMNSFKLIAITAEK
jgi:hypothetical protein